jgi:hypothetical protein
MHGGGECESHLIFDRCLNAEAEKFEGVWAGHGGSLPAHPHTLPAGMYAT